MFYYRKDILNLLPCVLRSKRNYVIAPIALYYLF